jgi:hypothetical protein
MHRMRIHRYRVIWQMPEIMDELPNLLQEAGRIVRINWHPKLSLSHAQVTIELSQPLQVGGKGPNGPGPSINRDTKHIIGHHHNLRLSTWVTQLPADGDRQVELNISLDLESQDEEEVITLEDMRAELRKLAALVINGPWHIM